MVFYMKKNLNRPMSLSQLPPEGYGVKIGKLHGTKLKKAPSVKWSRSMSWGSVRLTARAWRDGMRRGTWPLRSSSPNLWPQSNSEKIPVKRPLPKCPVLLKTIKTGKNKERRSDSPQKPKETWRLNATVSQMGSQKIKSVWIQSLDFS